MLNSTKIAELQGRIATLETSLAAAEGKSVSLEAQLSQAKTDLATAQAEAEKVAVLTTEITQLKADLATANAKATQAEASLATAQAEMETKISTEVTNRLASAGVDPIKRDPEAKTGQDDKGSVEGLKGRARLAAVFNKQFGK